MSFPEYGSSSFFLEGSKGGGGRRSAYGGGVGVKFGGVSSSFSLLEVVGAGALIR